MAWPNVYGLHTARFQQGEQAPQPKPTILLVHDAFHSSGHFATLSEELEDAGFKVLNPQLPSSSSVPNSNALEADIRTLINAALPEIDHGRHVIVVAHGYGCIPAAVAADRLNQYSLDRPRAGEVKRLIMIAGVVLKPGESFEDVLEPEWMVDQGGLVRAHKPGNVFFQDCPIDVKTDAIALVRTQAESSLRTTVAYPGWTLIPAIYMLCEGDNAIPLESQHEFMRTLQTSNRRTAVLSVQSGHCPFLSRPRDIAAVIARYSC